MPDRAGYGGHLVKELCPDDRVRGSPGAAGVGERRHSVEPLDEKHPEVLALQEAYHAEAGTRPPVNPFYAWSDACYHSYFGEMPTLIFGAGTPNTAHGPEEYNETERISACARILTRYLFDRLSRTK